MKLYGLETVNKYINSIIDSVDIDVITGSLIDTYIIYHFDANIIEVFEEKYINCWSSAYIRHIYKKGLPKRFIQALEKQYQYELEMENKYTPE